MGLLKLLQTEAVKHSLHRPATELDAATASVLARSVNRWRRSWETIQNECHFAATSRLLTTCEFAFRGKLLHFKPEPALIRR
jgi:hypothetical protein